MGVFVYEASVRIARPFPASGLRRTSLRRTQSFDMRQGEPSAQMCDDP